MKKAILSLVSLALVAVMLFAFAACSKGPYNGTYTDKWGDSVKLSGSKWTAYEDGEAFLSGKFEVDEETGAIVLLAKDEETGEEFIFDYGIIKDGVLQITEGEFYLEGSQESTKGDKGANANSLANAMSSAFAEYGWD